MHVDRWLIKLHDCGLQNEVATRRTGITRARALVRHACRQLHGAALHIPLKLLDQERLEPCKAHRFLVLDTGDARARQACVRLSRVFGFDAALALL